MDFRRNDGGRVSGAADDHPIGRAATACAADDGRHTSARCDYSPDAAA